MGFSVKMQLSGADATFAALRTLRTDLEEKVLKEAVSAAGTPIVSEIRRLVPVEFGFLKARMAKVVRLYKDRHFVLAVIGPKVAPTVTVTLSVEKVYRIIRGVRVRIKSPLPEQLSQQRNPLYYAHLVEFGTKDTPARAPIRRGFEAARGKALAAFEKKAAAGLKKYGV